MKIYLIIILLWSWCHAQNHDHERVKRFVGQSGDACMQIFTTPKKSIQCEPTFEVANDIKTLKSTVETQQQGLDGIGSRVTELEKPKDIPAYAKAKLDQLDAMKQTQAGQTESIKRLEAELQHLTDRVAKVETSDRDDLARLIELQSNLIHVTLNKANATVHGSSNSALASRLAALTNQLQALETDTRKEMYSSETKLENDMKKYDEAGTKKVDQLKELVDHKVENVYSTINAETHQRKAFENRTSLSAKETQEIRSQLTSVRQVQDRLSQHEVELKQKVEKLEKLLADKAGATEMSDKYDILRRLVEYATNQTTHLNTQFSVVQQDVHRQSHVMPRTLKVADCQDALTYFHPASGVYKINPVPVSQPFEVYCQMTGDAGWTVIQKRQDGALDFFRTWDEYKAGFGDPAHEYWLGLNKIHAMTSLKKYRLRIDLQDWDDRVYNAEYSSFLVGNEDTNFQLQASGYSGDAGDSLAYHNGMPFSTPDKPNDKNQGVCPELCHGGWWYKDCFHANLNGRYYNTGSYVTKSGWGDGIVWRHIHGTNFFSLKAVVMKIKPQ